MESSDIKFGMKETLAVFSMVLGLFSLATLFIINFSSVVHFYDPMIDVTGIANETKDREFSLRKGSAPNDGYSETTSRLLKAYNADKVGGTVEALSKGDVNDCFRRFERNYDKAYACLASFPTQIAEMKESLEYLSPATKKIYDIQSCAYSVGYDDFVNCMKNIITHSESWYDCLAFDENELQFQCFDMKLEKFFATRNMLEYFNIEQKKNEVLFDLQADGKIVRKKVTSEILKEHPEFLMKYRFFAPKLENFAELEREHPEIFKNANFIKALDAHGITK